MIYGCQPITKMGRQLPDEMSAMFDCLLIFHKKKQGD